ncbi:MAG TPA: MarR family transcriptional regulator [Acidimicrobiales bacterium]|nr:MarR family transcriptional regulator [Acidimicrobiales bacterium]
MSEGKAVDALLRASRALVAVAAASLAEVEDVTLPQYRALVLLSARPRTTVSELAAALGIHSTTATRLTDRLVRKQLVVRSEDPEDRRVTTLRLAPGGRRIVTDVMRTRSDQLRRIVAEMPHRSLPPLIEALESFSRAAGEPDELNLFGWAPATETGRT